MTLHKGVPETESYLVTFENGALPNLWDTLAQATVDAELYHKQVPNSLCVIYKVTSSILGITSTPINLLGA